jgi:hypothetical protein
VLCALDSRLRPILEVVKPRVLEGNVGDPRCNGCLWKTHSSFYTLETENTDFSVGRMYSCITHMSTRSFLRNISILILRLYTLYAPLKLPLCFIKHQTSEICGGNGGTAPPIYEYEIRLVLSFEQVFYTPNRRVTGKVIVGNCMVHLVPTLWSSGQSSWVHNGEVFCFL